MALALERSRDLSRVIVHVDMDAFYAAVEMRDCAELKTKPMAVGSMSMLVGKTILFHYRWSKILCMKTNQTSLCVCVFFFKSTSNYLARKYGVRAAMPGFIAKKLCSDLVIVPPNFDKYRAVSDEVRGKHTSSMLTVFPFFKSLINVLSLIDKGNFCRLRSPLPTNESGWSLSRLHGALGAEADLAGVLAHTSLLLQEHHDRHVDTKKNAYEKHIL